MQATEYQKLKKPELVTLCKERKLKGYSGKNKTALIEILVKNPIVVVLSTNDVTITNDVLGDELRLVDLFAGTGAFTFAFQEESDGKVKCVFANDMVDTSKKIYDLNFTHKLTLKDIHEVKNESVPEHDILCGGFSCQPFSIAGLQQGFKDKRSNVFWKILEIIDFRNPRCVILENVKNLVSHDNGNTFKTIKNELEKRGYFIHTKVLNTAKITGIPQNRERIYIVCFKSKEHSDKFSLDFPEITKLGVATKFDTTPVPDKYYYTQTSSTWKLLEKDVTKRNTIYQYRRVYVRENKSNECPTLTANMGTGGHNVPIIMDEKGIRKLTPRECFRFQGFPDSYRFPPGMSDSALYKLAGNAVSVPVVRLIAQRVLQILRA